MPVIYKVYWMLHTLAVVIAIGITGSYFVIEYDPGKDNQRTIIVCYILCCIPPPQINYLHTEMEKESTKNVVRLSKSFYFTKQMHYTFV
jgi:hypothetical protein